MKLQLSLEVLISIAFSMVLALLVLSMLFHTSSVENRYFSAVNEASTASGTYIENLPQICGCVIKGVSR